MATSATSKRSSVSRKNRRMDPDLLKRAKRIVERYQVVIRRESDGYYGRGLELPGAMGDGPTPEACMDAVRESMAALVGYMIEEGETPPPPAADATKIVQLNVRVTAGDKLLFEEAARQRGQGLSEFIRSAAAELIRR